MSREDMRQGYLSLLQTLGDVIIRLIKSALQVNQTPTNPTLKGVRDSCASELSDTMRRLLTATNNLQAHIHSFVPRGGPGSGVSSTQGQRSTQSLVGGGLASRSPSFVIAPPFLRQMSTISTKGTVTPMPQPSTPQTAAALNRKRRDSFDEYISQRHLIGSSGGGGGGGGGMRSASASSILGSGPAESLAILRERIDSTCRRLFSYRTR